MHHHPLRAAFWLTAVFALVEVAGGLWANSLALLADAAHMLSDVVALGLAMLARRIASRPAHEKMTYGYGRAKVLAAQLNALMLCFLSGWIVWEAAGRFGHPPEVGGMTVLWVAAAGLIVNVIIMSWLHGSHDINTRAAYWHVLGDALGSIAALVAGIVIVTTGWMPIDPLLSVVVAVILLWGGWKLIRETTLELMEAVPSDVDTAAILRCLQDVEGVQDVHHLHLWLLPAGGLALSAHIQLHDMLRWPALLPVLQQELRRQGIEHATLQPEVQCHDVVRRDSAESGLNAYD